MLAGCWSIECRRGPDHRVLESCCLEPAGPGPARSKRHSLTFTSPSTDRQRPTLKPRFSGFKNYAILSNVGVLCLQDNTCFFFSTHATSSLMRSDLNFVCCTICSLLPINKTLDFFCPLPFAFSAGRTFQLTRAKHSLLSEVSIFHS